MTTSIDEVRDRRDFIADRRGALRPEAAAPPTRGAGRFAAVALGLMALAITIPGLLWLLSPGVVAGGSGVALVSEFLNEARAIGGTRLGVAIALGVAAVSPRTRPTGLVVGIVVFGCTFLGRVVSNVLDGAPGAMAKPEIAEVILVALALFALRRKSARQDVRRADQGGE